MSYEGLLRITKTAEYLDIDSDVRRRVIGSMDETLARRTDVAQIREDIRDEMADAVPEAWRVLMANLRQKRDLKAALEILDRDPQRQFVKNRPESQTQVGVGVQVRIDSQALAQAVKEAQKTHEMIERASRTKPGEA